MKKQNQNNPVVIGSLLVVLLGAVVVIFRSFVPQSELTFTPAPVAATPSAPIVLPETGALTVGRDPFFHSDIQRIAAAGEKLTVPETVSAGANGEAFPISGPFDNQSAPDGKTTANSAQNNKLKNAAPVATPKPSAKKFASPDPAVAENALAQSLRLTAILGGDRPRAILEGAAPQPAVVSVGSEIGILRVAAIRAQEIILSGKSGFWTIPLQSAAPSDSATAPPPADTPALDGGKSSRQGDKESTDEAGK